MGAARIVLLFALFCTAAPAAMGRKDPDPAPPIPEIRTLETARFDQRIDWHLSTEAGFLHVYSGGRLQTYDLLDGGRRSGEPLDLPGAGERAAVTHFPGTSFLLIAAARRGALGGGGDLAGTPERETSSYLVDFLTGKALWEGPPLRMPDAVVYYPEVNLALYRAGSHGRDLTAIDLSTGRHLWNQKLDVQYAGLRSGMIEVFGEESGVLDPLTGRRYRAFRLPTSPTDRIFTFPSGDRVVVWEWDDFQAWSFPPLPPGTVASDLPATIEPKRLWTFEAASRMVRGCILNGYCWARTEGTDRLLVGSAHRIELLDIGSGERLWLRDKKSYVRDLAVSPSGRLGAQMDGDEILLVDMKTGDDVQRARAPKALSGKKAWHLAHWLSEEEMIFLFHDSEWSPRGLARFDVAGNRTLYNKELPEPADFRLTSRQKGEIVGKVFALVALVAVGAPPAPVALAPAPSQILMQSIASNMAGPGVMSFASLATDPAPESGRDDPEAGSRPSPAATRMADRARDRRRRAMRAAKTELFVVTGENDRYRVVAVDLADGTERQVGFYSRPAVHSITLDVAGGLAISTEENERVLRILRLPETAGTVPANAASTPSGR